MKEEIKILYPPTVNWGIMFQRPNQIMRALAKHGFKSYFYNHSPHANEGEFQDHNMVEIEPNLFIVPANTSMHDIKPDIFYYSYPVHIRYAKGIKVRTTIFDCVDVPTAEFESWKPDWEESVETSDFVMAVSKILYKEAQKYNDNVAYIPNGVDYAHYQKRRRNPYRKLKAKGYNRKKPVVLFMGAVATWVNIELIYESCKTYPEYNFILLGLEYNHKLINKPDNLFFIGHKTYDDLPMYLNHMTIGTIPFRDNEVAQGSNPLKTWEYLATGNPVVSTNLSETKKKGIYWSKNDEEYIKNIGLAVEHKLDGNKDEKIRRELAKEHDWTTLVKPMVEFIEGEM